MSRSLRPLHALRVGLAACVLFAAASHAGPAQDAVTAEVLKEPFASTRYQMLGHYNLSETPGAGDWFSLQGLAVNGWSRWVQTDAGSARFYCLAMTVPEGETWEFRGYGLAANGETAVGELAMSVGVGADCASPKTRWVADTRRSFVRANSLTFTSGGGTYLLRARWPVALGDEYNPSEGPLQLEMRRVGKGVTAGRVAPGVSEEGMRKDQRKLAASVPVAGHTPNAKLKPGTVFRDCEDCPEMVVLPAGRFQRGAPTGEAGATAEERPMQQMTLAVPFAMSVTEVTFEQLEACVAAAICLRPPDSGWGRGKRPVGQIPYREAILFALWLSEKTGAEYFVPTESEWEYAARAGTETPWNTGDAILGEDANILGQYGKTLPVGGYPANRFGLHDMHGNVAEWVRGCVDTGYFGAPTNGLPMLQGDCEKKVVRGGSFSAMPNEARSAARRIVPASSWAPDIGFRLVRRL